jgi:hypothetical protein
MENGDLNGDSKSSNEFTRVQQQHQPALALLSELATKPWYSHDGDQLNASGDASKRQLGPSTDVISNPPSLPMLSTSINITNPGISVNHLNDEFNVTPVTGLHDMNAVSFGLQPQHVPFSQQDFTQGHIVPPSNLPYITETSMDMRILSAEQFDDRGGFWRSTRRPEQRRQQQQQRVMDPMDVFGLVDHRKETTRRPALAKPQRSSDSEHVGGEKRKKKQKLSSEDEGDDDAAKKARGRPRLDTKDETAADVSFLFSISSDSR